MSMSAPRLSLSALLVAVVMVHGGCSQWRMSIILRTSAETNQGRPLQVIVRSVTAETYRSEPYSALAHLLIQPDKSVLRMLTIYPREQSKRRLFITAPTDTPVALYFLYLSQTGSWKILLPPRLPWSISVPLGRNGVTAESVRECRLGR